ncbi:MAG: hypothetical protein R3D32_11390 [Nitratireductor sp.]
MNWLAILAAALAALRQVLNLISAHARSNANETETEIRQKAQSYDRMQKAIRIREGLRNGYGSGDAGGNDGSMRDAPYRRNED